MSTFEEQSVFNQVPKFTSTDLENYRNPNVINEVIQSLVNRTKYLSTMIESMTITAGGAPVDYYRSNLPTISGNTVTIPNGLMVNINGIVYKSSSDVVLDVDATIDAATRAGTDVYIYACEPSDGGIVPDFILSQNSTMPNNYTAANSRKIGGFHCLCADVGTISGHALSGYVAGDILPASIWDLDHRPACDPSGMVYDENLNLFIDIYLNSWDGAKLVSVNKGTIADGTSTKKFHGELFVEELYKVKKRLPWRGEFQNFAKGSNEQTAINAAADPGTTGGHIDTAKRRMISNIGLEDCCGAYWQWTSDIPEGGAYGSADDTNSRLTGYSWSNVPTYNSAVDSQDYGSSYGRLRRLIVGGRWGNSSYCGSRCVLAYHYSAHVDFAFAARGVSELVS